MIQAIFKVGCRLLTGHAVAQCATSQKIAASILGGLIWVFIHLVLPAALGPVSEMSTRDISCERAAGGVGEEANA